MSISSSSSSVDRRSSVSIIPVVHEDPTTLSDDLDESPDWVRSIGILSWKKKTQNNEDNNKDDNNEEIQEDNEDDGDNHNNNNTNNSINVNPSSSLSLSLNHNEINKISTIEENEEKEEKECLNDDENNTNSTTVVIVELDEKDKIKENNTKNKKDKNKNKNKNTDKNKNKGKNKNKNDSDNDGDDDDVINDENDDLSGEWDDVSDVDSDDDAELFGYGANGRPSALSISSPLSTIPASQLAALSALSPSRVSSSSSNSISSHSVGSSSNIVRGSIFGYRPSLIAKSPILAHVTQAFATTQPSSLPSSLTPSSPSTSSSASNHSIPISPLISSSSPLAHKRNSSTESFRRIVRKASIVHAFAPSFEKKESLGSGSISHHNKSPSLDVNSLNVSHSHSRSHSSSQTLISPQLASSPRRVSIATNLKLRTPTEEEATLRSKLEFDPNKLVNFGSPRISITSVSGTTLLNNINNSIKSGSFDVSYSSMNGRAHPAYTRIDEIFNGCGEEFGLEIWRVEMLELVNWPLPQYGEFYSGDSYLILSTTGDTKSGFQWFIYYWIGSQSPHDSKMVAALKAMELQRHFSNKAKQQREAEGEESIQFKSLFPRGIKLLSGGIESALTHVEDEFEPPALYRLKGVKFIRVMQVFASINSLNSGDVYVLDTRIRGKSIISVWRGKDSNKYERWIAAEFSLRLKNFKKNRFCAVINIYDEGKEDREFWNSFTVHRNSIIQLQHKDQNQNFNNLKLKISSSTKEEDEKAESSAVLDLYKIGPKQIQNDNKDNTSGDSSDGGKNVNTNQHLSADNLNQLTSHPQNIEASLLEKDNNGNIIRKMLDSECCYLLDCDSELFLWIGKKTNEKTKITARKMGRDALKFKRPEWTKLVFMLETAETPLFKQKFIDWETPKYLQQPYEQANLTQILKNFEISKNPKYQLNIPHCFKQAMGVIASPSNLEDSQKNQNLTNKKSNSSNFLSPGDNYSHNRNPSTSNTNYYGFNSSNSFYNQQHFQLQEDDPYHGDLSILLIYRSALLPLPKEQYGVFSSSSSYICIYSYLFKGSLRYHIWYWQGIHAPAIHYLSFFFDIERDLTEALGETTGVPPTFERIFQGKEPKDFLILIGGISKDKDNNVNNNNNNSKEEKDKEIHNKSKCFIVFNGSKKNLIRSVEEIEIHSKSNLNSKNHKNNQISLPKATKPKIIKKSDEKEKISEKPPNQSDKQMSSRRSSITKRHSIDYTLSCESHIFWTPHRSRDIDYFSFCVDYGPSFHAHLSGLNLLSFLTATRSTSNFDSDSPFSLNFKLLSPVEKSRIFRHREKIRHHLGNHLFAVKVEDNAIRAFEVECSPRSLSSLYSFVLQTKNAFYVWHGCFASSLEKKAAVKTAKRLIQLHELRQKRTAHLNQQKEGFKQNSNSSTASATPSVQSTSLMAPRPSLTRPQSVAVNTRSSLSFPTKQESLISPVDALSSYPPATRNPSASVEKGSISTHRRQPSNSTDDVSVANFSSERQRKKLQRTVDVIEMNEGMEANSFWEELKHKKYLQKQNETINGNNSGDKKNEKENEFKLRDYAHKSFVDKHSYLGFAPSDSKSLAPIRTHIWNENFASLKQPRCFLLLIETIHDNTQTNHQRNSSTMSGVSSSSHFSSSFSSTRLSSSGFSSSYHFPSFPRGPIGKLFVAYEIKKFTQLDLQSDQVLLIDSQDELFVWQGKKADKTTKQLSGELAKFYAKALNEARNSKSGPLAVRIAGKKHETVKVVILQEGNETQNFKVLFPWFESEFSYKQDKYNYVYRENQDVQQFIEKPFKAEWFYNHHINQREQEILQKLQKSSNQEEKQNITIQEEKQQ